MANLTKRHDEAHVVVGLHVRQDAKQAPASAVPSDTPSRVIRKFSVTTTYTAEEEWELSDTHCPKCGAPGPWKKSDSLSTNGTPHLCTACGARYWLLLGQREVKEDAQRLGHLSINQHQDRHARRASPELNWPRFQDAFARIYPQPGHAPEPVEPASPESSVPAGAKTPSQRRRTRRPKRRLNQPTPAATPHRSSSSPSTKRQSTPRGGAGR